MDIIGGSSRPESFSLTRMALPLTIIVGAMLAFGDQILLAGAEQPQGIETSFAFGATLSARDLESVAELANLAGIERVLGVSTERHLVGTTITVRGDEKVHGRNVQFQTLRVHRDGWDSVKRPDEGARSVGEFWVETSAKLQRQERTIVRVGKREFRVGLLNGIKPEAADQVIVAAFVSGRVRYASDYAKERVSRMDFSRPEWLGISGGESWISFSSPGPLTGAVFRVEGKEVTVTGVLERYE